MDTQQRLENIISIHDMMRGGSRPAEKLVVLRKSLASVVSDPDTLPPFVFLPNGRAVVIDKESRDGIIQRIKKLDPSDNDVWGKTQLLVDGIKTDLEKRESTNSKSRLQLEHSVKEAESQVPADRREALDQQAETILAEDPCVTIGEQYIEAFKRYPKYAPVGKLLSEIVPLSAKINDLITEGKDKISAVKLLKSLLDRRVQLPSGSSISVYNFISESLITDIVLLRNSMSRDPKNLDRNWERFSTLSRHMLSLVNRPETMLRTIYKLELGNSFGNGNIPPEDRKQLLADLDKSLEFFPSVRCWYAYANIRDRILSSDKSPSETRYLLCKTASLALEKGIFDADMTIALSQGDDDLTKEKMTELIQLICSTSSTIGSSSKERAAQVATDIKKINTVMLVSMVANAALAPLTPAHIATVSSTMQTQLEVVRESFEKIKWEMPQLPKLPRVDVRLPPLLPVQDVIPSSFTPPDISQENMSWASSSVGNEAARLTSMSSVSPEQFLRQSLRIDWHLEAKSGQEFPYIITRLLPYYDAKANSFGGAVSITSRYAISDQVDKSDLIFTAKRQYFNDNLLSVPRIWDYSVSSSRVEIIDPQTQVVKRVIPVSVAVSKNGDQFLELQDSFVDLSSSDEIRIAIGLDKGLRIPFDKSILSEDRDAKFPTRSIYPTELNSLVDELNRDKQMSDLDKLTRLKTWFLDKSTYSMDPVYSQYYLKGNPSPETFYRRFFGTGDTKADPDYIANQAITMKGVCESVNVAYALAARELDLTNGQIMLGSGYSNTGFYSGNKSSLTQGQLHAWAVYLDRNGNLTHMDATPSKIDAFTQKVLSATRNNPGIAGDRLREIPFTPQTEISGALNSEINPPFEIPVYNMLTYETIRDRVDRLIDPEENTWFYKQTGYIDIGRTPSIGNIHINSKLAWVVSSEMPTYPVPLDGSFPEKNSILDRFPKADPNNLEDGAFEISGTFRLQGNSIVLPNSGQISPRSISVNMVRRDEKGTTVKTPIAIKFLQKQPYGFGYSNYILTLDAAIQDLRDKKVEISYKTAYSFYQTDVRVDSLEQGAKLFPKIVERERLGENFTRFLDALEKAKTWGEFDDAHLADFSLDDYFPNSDEIRKMNGFNETRMNDRHRIALIAGYINQNFEFTLDNGWKKMYSGDNPDVGTFLERVTRYRQIDMETYAVLLVAAARTMPSETGTPNLPVQIQLDHIYGGSDVLHINKEKLQQGDIVPVLLLYSFNKEIPEFYVSESVSPWFRENKESGPLVKDSFARLARDLKISHPDIMVHGVEDSWILPWHEKDLLTLWEKTQIFGADWWLNRGNMHKAGDAAAFLIPGIVAADYLRRRTWWHNISRRRFRRCLEFAETELGMTRENKFYEEMKDFYDRILNVPPSQRLMHIVEDDARRIRGGFKQTDTGENQGIFEPAGGKALLHFLSTDKFPDIPFGNEKRRLWEIAQNKDSKFDTASQRFARKLLTDVFHQPVIADLLREQIRAITESAAVALADYFGTDEPAKIQETIYEVVDELEKRNTSTGDYRELSIDLERRGILYPVKYHGIIINLLKHVLRNSFGKHVSKDEITVLMDSLPVSGILDILAGEVIYPYHLLLHQEMASTRQFHRQNKERNKKRKREKK